MGYSIDKEWLNKLALQTQIVIKKSPLNYAHGRVLYSLLRNYLRTNSKKLKGLNIVETGTARGFSSLYMAKALFDSDPIILIMMLCLNFITYLNLKKVEI